MMGNILLRSSRLGLRGWELRDLRRVMLSNELGMMIDAQRDLESKMMPGIGMNVPRESF